MLATFVLPPSIKTDTTPFFIDPSGIPANALSFTYDPSIVALSFVQIAVAAFLAITIIHYATQELTPKRRTVKEIMASMILGTGIWCMHFTGMLAMETNMVHSFDILSTVLSGLPAILFSWITFRQICNPNYSNTHPLLYAPLLGVGVAFMHYFGMSAMKMDAVLYHTPFWFSISIAIAVIASAAAMALLRLTNTTKKNIYAWRFLVSLIIGLAVCGLHYTGMMAAVIVPLANCRFDINQNHGDLVAAITIVCLINNIGIFTSFLIYKARRYDSHLRLFNYLGPARRKILIILVLGMTLSIMLPIFMHLNEVEKQQDIHRKNLEILSHSIESSVENAIRNIQIAQDFFTASNSVSNDEFKIFAKGLVFDEDIIHYVAFVPDGTRSDKSIYIHPANHRPDVPLALPTGTFLSDIKDGPAEHTSLKAIELSFPVITKISANQIPQRGYIVSSLSFSAIVDNAIKGFPGLNLSWSVTPIDKNFESISLMVSDPRTGSPLKALTIFISILGASSVSISGIQLLVGVLGILVTLSTCGYVFFATQQKNKDAIYKKALEIKLTEIERANEVKTSFFSNMTHELRTPLNSIIGMLGFLRETRLDQEQEEMVETTLTSSNILLQIINSILDFSKIEAGEVKLENIGFDLLSAVQRSFRSVQPLAIQKGINFITEIDDETLQIPYLLGDPLRITQIITNLLSNAVKYTDHGSVNLVVSSKRMEDDRIDVEIHIKDTGIGIPEEKLESVFEKFSQADISTTRKYGGTGLGLSIAYKIVELMGGEMHVNSVVDEGSDFWFRIPFHTTDTLETSHGTIKDGTVMRNKDIFSCFEKKIPIKMARILIAEDHSMNQIFIRKVMERFGNSNYTLVENGMDAVREFENGDYHIILMDCFMPLKNGYDASLDIRAMEAQQGKGRHIPIIAMTANAMSGDSQKCFEALMTAYIPKPINVLDLKNLISEWIDFGPSQAEHGIETSTDMPDELFPSIQEVDLSNLREFAMGDENILKEMIEAFVEQSDMNMSILWEMISDGENKTWSEAAHMLKGGAGGIGAENLRKLAAEAQEMLVATHEARVQQYAAIETSYLAVKRYLRDQRLLA